MFFTYILNTLLTSTLNLCKKKKKQFLIRTLLYETLMKRYWKIVFLMIYVFLISTVFSLFRSHQLTRVQQRSVRRRHQRATFVSLGQSVMKILRTCGESQTRATDFQGPDVLFFREPEGFRNMGPCLMVCIRCRVFCRPVSVLPGIDSDG